MPEAPPLDGRDWAMLRGGACAQAAAIGGRTRMIHSLSSDVPFQVPAERKERGCRKPPHYPIPEVSPCS